MKWIHKLVEEHQFFRRISLVAAWVVIGYDNWRLFQPGGLIEAGHVSGPVATTFTAVTGLLGTVITWAYYKNRSISRQIDYSEKFEAHD